MCRLLAIKSENDQSMGKILQLFAQCCKESKEYQGDGWGYSYRYGNTWKTYRSFKPIWEDNFTNIPNTQIMLVHARSASFGEPIVLENNMPFEGEKYDFIFNGELKGVRLKEKGRIGAEKLFNFILRFTSESLAIGIAKAMNIIKNRTRYIRAMNVIILDKRKSQFLVYSHFNEDQDYFTLNFHKTDSMQIICSIPMKEYIWHKVAQDTVQVI